MVRYSNRDSFAGDYVNGKKNGRGTYMYFGSGDSYNGQWKEDMKHGMGRMEYKGKGREGEYQGYWENDRRHGEGVFTYQNGDTYSGWWRFGNKEGKGTFTSKATGMKLVGDWANGEMTHGRWIYPNGFYYEGSFQNNKPSGEGKWHCKDGNVISGAFVQKKKEAGEDEAPPEEEEEGGAQAVQKFELTWTTDVNIVQSAKKVNSVVLE